MLLLGASLAALTPVCARADPGSVTPLGTLGGTYSGDNFVAISADGSAVVGDAATTGNAQQDAFRWTQAGGMVDLGTLGGTSSLAQGVSADGSVVVGQADTGSEFDAFRWTQAGGMVDLGTLGGTYSTAYGVSADGSVVVGQADTGSEFDAFRWTQAGGMVDLGTLGGTSSYAYGVSADGSVVVGQSDTGIENDAFRWTQAGGMVDLGTLGGAFSVAYGVSADGSVVVGQANTGIENDAFRWTQAGGMVDLGTLGGAYSIARAVSADGSVVVGQSSTGNIIDAFRWTQATGMRDLNTLLGAAGVNMAGAQLSNATGISSNGQYIVGTGTFYGQEEAYIVKYTAGGGGGGTPTSSLTPLGSLGGSYSGDSFVAISGDGSVVVGDAGTTGDAQDDAFRWTQAGGMVDLGTLGGAGSNAYGVSADGSVVVGRSDTGSENDAFRWTQAGGMVDLGTLGGAFSVAYGVSADGSVVVGQSDTGIENDAFRWTQAGGMVDLGTLGGAGSNAYGVSADGSVVVGDSNTGLEQDAFRWTQAGGMVDLGTLGGTYSTARAVSADGSVVVGRSSTGHIIDVFRWTQATGMRDLNTLLGAAGVNMAGTQLSNATGISSNGQYIVGTGTFYGQEEAYIVKYIAGGGGGGGGGGTPPIAGLTTAGAQQTATQGMATSQQTALIDSRSVANTLLGMAQPVTGGSFTEAGGIFGSAVGTFSGQYAMQGVTVLGGLAYGHESTPGVAQRDAASVALALRYTFLHEHRRGLHPYAEAGGWVTPREDLTFSRPYMNGAGTATGQGATTATQAAGYGKLGVAYDVTAADQLNGWGDLGREYLSFSGYSETLSPANPFPAVVQNGMARMDVARGGLSWTHRLNHWLAVTASGAVAHSFDVHPGLNVSVAPLGTMTAEGHASTWGEFGTRLEIGLTDRFSVNLSAEGTSGGSGVGTSLHGGGGVSYRF